MKVLYSVLLVVLQGMIVLCNPLNYSTNLYQKILGHVLWKFSCATVCFSLVIPCS